MRFKKQKSNYRFFRKGVPTPQTEILNQALVKRGLHTITEFYDGHKHIDIALPFAKIYIEVDGLQHLMKADQILADFEREHYSDMKGFHTLHIPNLIIEKDVTKVARAIEKLAKRLIKQNQVSTPKSRK